MDLEKIPDDVLHAIFRELNGISAVRCRQVCIRWKEAVDSLSDKDWQKICSDEEMYQEYVRVHSKYGLSWRETYKAINSWKDIGSYKMSLQELCSKVERFKVLPKGIVACLLNKTHLKNYGCSDTIVYYNTETFQECGKEEFDFPFLSDVYEENEYFKVLVRRSGKLCIIINETNQHFTVGDVVGDLLVDYEGYTVIGKEVYFKDRKDEIIYVSKYIKKDGIPTIETKPLEAFLENHGSYEESVIAYAIKDGNVIILSDEGNKGNIYIHENADFGWVSQLEYDQGDIFLELQDYNLNWKSPSIYNWVSSNIMLSPKSVFYSHGNIYLTTRSFGKIICIYYYPYHIYCPEHLVHVFIGEPNQQIPKRELMVWKERELDGVTQLDIIETPTSHKILVKLGKKLIVTEFTPPGHEESSPMKTRSRTVALKPARQNKTIQVKKKPATYKTAKKRATNQKGTKKTVQAKRKRN